MFTVGTVGRPAAASVTSLIDGGTAPGDGLQPRSASPAPWPMRATALLVGGALFLLAVWLPRARGPGAGDQAAAASRRARALGLGGGRRAGAAATAGGHRPPGRHRRGHELLVRARPDRDRGRARHSLRRDVGAEAGRVRGAGRAARGWPRGARGRAWVLALAAMALAALVLTPGLAGHAGAEDSALLVPADALHVTAMSAWVGGVALLLLALPAATRSSATRARLGVLERGARPLLGGRAGGRRGAGGHRHRSVDRAPRLARATSPTPRSGARGDQGGAAGRA